jgi:hypothetical protein
MDGAETFVKKIFHKGEVIMKIGATIHSDMLPNEHLGSKQLLNPKLVTLIKATLSQFTQEEAHLVNEIVACDYTL